MRSLAAVEPDGLGIVNHDGEYGELVLGSAGSDRLKAREDALDSGVDLADGLAGVVKVRLRDGVITGKELKLDHGTGLGLDLLGPELEAGCVVDGVAADGDDLDTDSCTTEEVLG